MYTCSMHPEIKSYTKDKCPICHMSLISVDNKQSIHHSTKEEQSYKPLFIIISFIVLITTIVAIRDVYVNQFLWKNVMMNFMAGFFLVFSGFKFLNIKGFAEGYSTYDLLANKIFNYGYVYPFVELFLGAAFLLHLSFIYINIFTFILMIFSGTGVALKMLKHEKFQCACLGTFLKVPLTKITLIEDFGMALMALIMIFI